VADLQSELVPTATNRLILCGYQLVLKDVRKTVKYIKRRFKGFSAEQMQLKKFNRHQKQLKLFIF
jgi:hypothetical protein